MLIDLLFLIGIPMIVIAMFSVAVRLLNGRTSKTDRDDSWWQAIK
jgi:hypothetical protein